MNVLDRIKTWMALEEAELSHKDIAKTLRMAIGDAHTGDNWIWVKDTYDDRVVYEITNRHTEDSALLQRTYSIDDNGKVTLGDAVEVRQVTTYEPIEEAGSVTERTFTQDQRDTMAKNGQAMRDGSYPIANKADLRNAINAYGRAKNKSAVKSHITKRAKALNATDLLPADWSGSTKKKESAEPDALAGDVVPLIEKAVNDDGLVDIKVIAPGWGSSGYYSDEVLQNAAGVIAPGTHMYVDHPTEEEELARPERTLRDLAAVTIDPVVYEAEGPQGPGLYTKARVFSGFREVLDEIAPHIGVSIRGRGRRSEGEVEGQKGLIVNSIEAMDSIDFVTLPGAGGAIGELVESARGNRPKGAETVTEQTTDQQAPAVESDELKEVKLELARMREREVLRDAREHVVRKLAEKRLPDIVASRLTETLAANPPFTDERALDTEKLDTQIEEAVTAELAYLEQVAPSGRVIGMGGTSPDETEEMDEAAVAKLDERLTSGFTALGLSESAAKTAVAH